MNTGGRQRSFHILSALAQAHDVRVVTTAGAADDPDGLARALGPAASVESFPYAVPKRGSAQFAAALVRSWLTTQPVDLWKWRVPAVRRRVHDLVRAGAVDVIVADFLFATPNIPSDLGVPVVFFAHNVEHLIWKQLHDADPVWWRRALLAIEWRKVRRSEAASCARAHVTVAVSSDDRQRLREIVKSDVDVAAIATGVDADYFHPVLDSEAPDRLVFSGSMDWYPNEDAVLYFVDTILPRIRRVRPETSLTIVGRNPTPRVRALADRPGIVVTGTVDDVRPAVAEGAVCVVPLRVGGGTRVKIFEAFAMGKAVVSTTIGAEGLAVDPGHDVILADDPDVFAASVVTLLEDPARRRALGAAARRAVEERHGWAGVARQFQAHLQEAIERHATPATRRPALP